MLHLSGWRWIFAFYVAIAALAGLWFMARQPEILARELRIPLSFRWLFLNAGCVVKNTRVMASTTAAVVGFGAQLLFLSTAQSVFSQIYPTGDMFAVYFAALAASTGLATPANSRLVSTVACRKWSFMVLVVMLFLDFSCCLQVFVRPGSSISLVDGAAVCDEFLCWAGVWQHWRFNVAIAGPDGGSGGDL